LRHARAERRLSLSQRRGDGRRPFAMARRRHRRTPALSEFTRPATWDDVKALARHLNDAGAEYALVGGYAIAAHGFNRFSEDIDILVNPTVENSRRWILALSRLPDGAARELSTDPDVFARDALYAI